MIFQSEKLQYISSLKLLWPPKQVLGMRAYVTLLAIRDLIRTDKTPALPADTQGLRTLAQHVLYALILSLQTNSQLPKDSSVTVTNAVKGRKGNTVITPSAAPSLLIGNLRLDQGDKVLSFVM